MNSRMWWRCFCGCFGGCFHQHQQIWAVAERNCWVIAEKTEMFCYKNLHKETRSPPRHHLRPLRWDRCPETIHQQGQAQPIMASQINQTFTLAPRWVGGNCQSQLCPPGELSWDAKRRTESLSCHCTGTSNLPQVHNCRSLIYSACLAQYDCCAAEPWLTQRDMLCLRMSQALHNKLLRIKIME